MRMKGRSVKGDKLVKVQMRDGSVISEDFEKLYMRGAYVENDEHSSLLPKQEAVYIL